MAELKVLTTLGAQPAYRLLLPEFERTGGHKVATEIVPTTQMVQRLRAGERPDLVLVGSDSADALVLEGKLDAASKVDFARSGIGVAVRKGTPRPDIATTPALIAALTAARSVAYSTGPSGVYLAELFERMGLAAMLKPKLTISQGGPVGERVARGEIEICFQQLQELLAVTGLDVLGPLPPDIQKMTVFSAARPVGAGNGEAVADLVRLLRSPAAARVYHQVGMEPV